MYKYEPYAIFQCFPVLSVSFKIMKYKINALKQFKLNTDTISNTSKVYQINDRHLVYNPTYI